ncbi:MAG TPA: response regulator [Streptosporangiaceae bacterium]|nr:response regulator [Streptosporangiaceae bacterium]
MTQARGRTEGSPAREDDGPAPRVLIVEDEPALLRALRINLRARGYDVAIAARGHEALTEARRHPPDVVLLDLGLPDLDGREVIRELRGWSKAPVIVLSGRAGSGDKIGALDAGADDYVTKPFDMEELLARLRAAMRRTDQSPHAALFRIGRHEIDITAHTIDGPADREQMHLTPTEWRLLEILLTAPGQLVGSDRLLGEVWGPGFERSTHYLRFHMAGLRRKLEEDPHRPRHLLTEPGMGYRYQP